jgi:uncharacterized protein YggU (UPF0235/DUF167 family)
MIRFSVHVHPGSKRSVVGGCYDGALIVHVCARAVNGSATRDTLDTLAIAFGVRPSAVLLVRGATSRTKIGGDDVQLHSRLQELLAT